MKTYHLTFDDYFIQNKAKQAAQRERERGGGGARRCTFISPALNWLMHPQTGCVMIVKVRSKLETKAHRKRSQYCCLKTASTLEFMQLDSIVYQKFLEIILLFFSCIYNIKLVLESLVINNDFPLDYNIYIREGKKRKEKEKHF